MGGPVRRVVAVPTGSIDENVPPTLDALRPTLPQPPGAFRRSLHRAAVLLGWAIGYRRIPRLDAWLQALFPWALTIAIGAPVAVIFDGLTRPIAAAFCAGVIMSGLFSWGLNRGTTKRAAAHLLGREVDLLQHAEDRAASVARQFGWAIDDLLSARAAVRDGDAKIVLAGEEVAVLRMVLEQRDRDIAEANQKVFEVGLFDVDRERSRVSEMQEAAAEVRAEFDRVNLENEQLRSDVILAARRIEALSASLRHITEVATGRHAASREEPEPIPFLWKLEFDGARNMLRVKPADDDVLATSARILDGHTIVARQIEAESGEASIDHDRSAGWQCLTVDEAVADRFRRADHLGLAFELRIDEEWRAAVPTSADRPRVVSIDGGRPIRRAAV